MPEPSEYWSETPEFLRLFPTFLWKAQLRPEVYEPINALLHSRLEAMRRGLPPLAAGAAWQSDHSLHRLVEMGPLVACIQAAGARVLEFLRVGAHPLHLTGCWANLNAPGAAHRMHTHPNNFLSGVYYVQVIDGADTIRFHDPRPETAVIRPPVTGLTAYNTDQVVVQVATGMLIVFPAWLPHSVAANQSALPRISVSFNLMFAAFAETMGEPLWGEA
jgi:uncharacterized protein (TIGR02466 family)